ncbi:MAG: KpsF/GutQ family sugar-phosphate isomerase [Chitinophagaceae bacterium]|nr:MAG: KpsF/GutQ family sugar-phosphate isomerase [Chitinophagaceae bacterium]
MKKDGIIPNAIRTISLQAEAVKALERSVNADFMAAVEKIAMSNGRLVISGIGKSAIIAQKIVATMNSTGTPSLFMHAADAIHGDLGMIQQDDIVLIISKSGDSPEIKVLVPLVKNFGNFLIGMVGNTESYLATHAHLVLNTTVSQEACPNNLAPTTSTTAQMVMGDALAVCLMELKGFNSEHFAKFHPGGTLGKKLYVRVSDVAGRQKPAVSLKASVREVIVEITRNRLGAVAVQNEEGDVKGIITDGDLRRMLESGASVNELLAKDIMSADPKTISFDDLAVTALDAMRTHNINQLLVLKEGTYMGVLHLQDLIREGII